MTYVINYIAASLSAGAGIVHFYIMPEHFEEYWAFGVFFLVVGTVQVGWGVTVALRRSLPLYYVGLVGTLTVIAIYVASRTVGLPLGPHTGEPEEIGIIDLVSKAVETGLILCLAYLIWRSHRRAGNRGTAV